VPYIDAMTANVAAALGISVDRVSIKGKTNEGVGERVAARRSPSTRSRW
jgi:2C-methyl-D-erythritol 2,4-cyclodiphosphate synthase